MYASSHIHTHPISLLTVIRWCARSSAIVLTLGWLGFALAELFHTGFYVPQALAFQGAALAVVFLGYAIGWQRELAGSLMVIVGTAAFFVITVLAVGTWPQMAAAWFAAPGVLYFEGWRREHRAVRQARP